MSRTYRKNKFNKKYTDSKRELERRYECNCWYCQGIGLEARKNKNKKFLDEEVRKEIMEHSSGVEHRTDTTNVGGSNPSVPTNAGYA
jgi:hypothetical protein